MIKHNFWDYWYVVVGFSVIISGLHSTSCDPWLGVVLGFIVIIEGIFNFKGYINKAYFLALFGIIALFGVHLLFSVPHNILYYYYDVGGFILFLIFFSWAYLRRHKRREQTWKNEW